MLKQKSERENLMAQWEQNTKRMVNENIDEKIYIKKDVKNEFDDFVKNKKNDTKNSIKKNKKHFSFFSNMKGNK